MTRLILAALVCAGLASALPAQAAVALHATSVTNDTTSSSIVDVRWHHHRRHHHPHA